MRGAARWPSSARGWGRSRIRRGYDPAVPRDRRRRRAMRDARGTILGSSLCGSWNPTATFLPAYGGARDLWWARKSPFSGSAWRCSARWHLPSPHSRHVVWRVPVMGEIKNVVDDDASCGYDATPAHHRRSASAFSRPLLVSRRPTESTPSTRCQPVP